MPVSNLVSPEAKADAPKAVGISAVAKGLDSWQTRKKLPDVKQTRSAAAGF